MTREEAIKGLKVLRRDFSGYKPNEEMFDMAIKAIEQESSGVYKVVEKILFYLDAREKVANDEWVSFEFKELQKFIRECLKEMSIKALSQEPCDDAISREYLKKIAQSEGAYGYVSAHDIATAPSVTQKSGKCKNCKYFEYDSVAKVDGVPLIVAHEICNKWGNGCKTSEDGYCYLFEPQESKE